MNSNLNIQLQNNTPFNQPVSLFNNGNIPALNAASPDFNLYSFDVTGFVFATEQTVSIQQKPIGGSFTTYSATIATFTIQGVCDALNTLNIGQFFTTTTDGNTYIQVYSNENVYGNLRIYNNTQLEIVYTFNCPTSVGSITLGNQFVPPTVSVTLPSTTTNGNINLNTTFVINNPGGVSVIVNYTITVNGVLQVTDSFNFVPLSRNYTYAGGDLVVISFFE